MSGITDYDAYQRGVYTLSTSSSVASQEHPIYKDIASPRNQSDPPGSALSLDSQDSTLRCVSESTTTLEPIVSSQIPESPIHALSNSVKRLQAQVDEQIYSILPKISKQASDNASCLKRIQHNSYVTHELLSELASFIYGTDFPPTQQSASCFGDEPEPGSHEQPMSDTQEPTGYPPLGTLYGGQDIPDKTQSSSTNLVQGVGQSQSSFNSSIGTRLRSSTRAAIGRS